MLRVLRWCQIHCVSQLVFLCCLVWVIGFLLVGGKGKMISIGIGMIPPLVIAGTATGAMGWIGVLMPSRRWLTGDWNLYRATLGLIMAPLVFKNIRIAYEYGTSNPDKLANQLGISTLPAIALALLPVTRYSRILAILGWTPPHVIHEIHVSLGWYAVWAGVLHATYYIYVWLTQHEGSWRIFVPEFQCILNPDAVPVPCPKCDCPRRLHYVTGSIVLLAFATITSTSLPFVRRRFYDWFYRTHVMAVPVMILFLYMHWSKTSLYISGGVIVYVATWAPNYLEQLMRKTTTSVRIIAVDCIHCRGDNQNARNVIVLTIASSKNAVYLAGNYVKLHALQFSPVSHPFTVVAGPEQDGTIRIMFRQVGKFTQALGEAFEHSVTECSSEGLEGTGSSSCFPILRLDGFHGGVDRLRQILQHDHVVLVAGGIGITPMLTMISQLLAVDAACQLSSPLTSLTLHWMCRDAALVRYVKNRYFEVWAETTSHVPIVCIIHKTTGTPSTEYSSDSSHAIVHYPVPGSDQTGHAFEPSLLSNHWMRHYVSALNVSIIGVNTLIVYLLYYMVPSRDNVLKALYVPLLVVAWALTMSLAIILYLSPRSSYQELPVSDYFGATRTVKTKSSFNNEFPNETKEFSTWAEQTGRPSVSEMMTCLDKASNPGVFLCGPPSLISNVKTHVPSHCCGSSPTKTAVYVEHFAF